MRGQEGTREDIGPFPAGELVRYCFCSRASYWRRRLPEQRLEELQGTVGVMRLRGRRLHAEVGQRSLRELQVALGLESGIRRKRHEVKVMGRRWFGRVDLVLELESGEVVLVEIKSSARNRRGARSQLGAYLEAWSEEHREPARGMVWELVDDEYVYEVLMEDVRGDLDEMYDELAKMEVSCRFPETHAPPSACKVCEYLGMCDDDLWREREEPGEEDIFVYKSHIF